MTSPASLAGNSRGVAAVEFAMITPLLLLLYFGSVEATQGFMAQQKVAHTASAIGDLVAQDSTVTTSQVSDILSSGATYMYPYATSSLKLRVTSLSANSKGNVTVAWSEGSGGLAGYAKGSSYSPPAGVISASGSAIMGEAQYTYTSVFGQILPNPITFDETYYLQPRVSTAVTCSDC